MVLKSNQINKEANKTNIIQQKNPVNSLVYVYETNWNWYEFHQTWILKTQQ